MFIQINLLRVSTLLFKINNSPLLGVWTQIPAFIDRHATKWAIRKYQIIFGSQFAYIFIVDSLWLRSFGPINWRPGNYLNCWDEEVTNAASIFHFLFICSFFRLSLIFFFQSFSNFYFLLSFFSFFLSFDSHFFCLSLISFFLSLSQFHFYQVVVAQWLAWWLATGESHVQIPARANIY